MKTSINVSHRILFADTDAGGMMYFGNAARFVEAGINEWFRSNSLSFLKRSDLNLFWVVRELRTLYSKTIGYDETIDINVVLTRIMRFTLVFDIEISSNEIQKIKSQVRLVSMNKDSKQTIPIPDEIFKHAITINSLKKV